MSTDSVPLCTGEMTTAGTVESVDEAGGGGGGGGGGECWSGGSVYQINVALQKRRSANLGMKELAGGAGQALANSCV